jgi:PPOX class probable F420-dependent enzyme
MPSDLDHVRRLVQQDSLAVFTTVRPDGTIHASVVNAGVVDDPISGDARVGLVAGGSSRKLRYLRASRRAAIVFRDGPDWVAVEGPVQLVGPRDRLESFGSLELPMLLRRVFVAAGGSHQDWDEFDRVMAAEERTAVLVTPERISSNG